MLIHQEDELSDFVKGEIDKILERLKRDEPIQYILGEARFYGMDLIIKPGVLIPRQETEELVDIIIDDNRGREDLEVLDLCSGSGCIAIALARNLPFSKVEAVDFSKEAIEVSRENNSKLKAGIKVTEGGIFDWEPEHKYDIIVSNPPYVMDREALSMEKNVLDYEPHEALFVRDENPLAYYERIAELAKRWLKTNGRLYFEINPLTARQLKEMLRDKGFKDVEIMRDTSGKERFCRITGNV